MNALPEHRRLSAGRTWSSVWRPESMNPISHYHRESRVLIVMVVLFAAVLAGVFWGLL